MLDKELEFLSKAKSGTVEELTELLKDDINLINSCDDYGNNALHEAAKGKRKDNFLFLQKYIQINSINRNGTTALHYAAQAGNEEIVKHCLDSGIDINERNKTGQAPIHYAAKGGHLEMIKMLNTKGADLHVEDGNGLTALNFAVNSKNDLVIKYLKENGVKIGTKRINPVMPKEVKPSPASNTTSQRAKRDFSQGILVAHEIGKLKLDNQKLEERVNRFQGERDLQKKEIDHLTEELSKAYEKIKLLEDELSEVKQENKVLKEERDSFKEQKERGDKQFSRAQTVITTYNKILNREKDPGFATKFANKDKQKDPEPDI
jgi:hypothetical protein